MKAQEEPTQSRSSIYQILVGLVEFRSLRVSYPTLITALETAIEEDEKGKAAYEARGLLLHIMKFEFILAFEVLLDLLMHTKSLSDYLQQKDLDFISATDMIASLQVVLQGKRSERSFNEYFTKTEEKCKELGIDALPKKYLT